MLRPYTNIQIQQITPFVYNGNSMQRSLLLNIDFVTEYEVESTWETHTDICTIKFPKNIVLDIQNGTPLFKQTGTYSVILGGTLNGDVVLPLIMRGDSISIFHGYKFFNQAGIQMDTSQIVSVPNIAAPFNVFNGYVSSVSSDIPIEIKCEDNFYLLKKTPIGITRFPTSGTGTSNLLALCQLMLDNTNKLFANNPIYTINGQNPYPQLILFNIPDQLTANFSLGYLDIDYATMSCSEVLSYLRNKYKIESFFKGNELWFGEPIYTETNNSSNAFFYFEDNIFPEHDLEYQNRDDIVISAIVSCQTYSKVISGSGIPSKIKSGSSSSKRLNQRVFIYWDIITEKWKWYQITPTSGVPENEGGERYDLKYPVDILQQPPTIEQMYEFGKQKLEKIFYNGFKGSFKTFGFPFVRWNDNVNLVSNTFLDRNGQYKVKKVVYRGGTDGISQEIHIAYRQLKNGEPVPLPTNTTQIYMI